MIVVTGGAGFIGANFVLEWLRLGLGEIVVADKLTYAGNRESLAAAESLPEFHFEQVDIADAGAVQTLIERYAPRAVVHFAAESHVDRSITGPGEFVRTNVNGTFTLLEATRSWLAQAGAAQRETFRFLHVSTDEVYGSLEPHDPAFCESAPYRPNSPYAASKAASDHLVRAYFNTYGLPVVTTNCGNNYGPLQFPEKLIPLALLNALDGRPIPIYGDGLQVRDWLYVTDHCAAIRQALALGQPGATYNVGARNERTNLDVVRRICAVLDEVQPLAAGSHTGLMTSVKDRPGHDRRYAIDPTKIESELGWRPSVGFDEGIRRTVEWYLSNMDWVKRVRDGSYRRWLAEQYGPALG